MVTDVAGGPRDPIAEAARQWISRGWAPAAEGMSLVTSIVRVQQLLSTRIDRVLAPFGLTFARFEILRLLAFTQAGQLPIGKMSERLQVHGTSVTSAVARLEAQGFVERRSSPADGRVVLVALTDAGRTAVEAATPRLNEEVFEALGLAEREVSSLARGLRSLRTAAGDP